MAKTHCDTPGMLRASLPASIWGKGEPHHFLSLNPKPLFILIVLRKPEKEFSVFKAIRISVGMSRHKKAKLSLPWKFPCRGKGLNQSTLSQEVMWELGLFTTLGDFG